MDRSNNRFGEDYIIDRPGREQAERERMAGPAVLLSAEQKIFIERVVPEICARGGWTFVECAASPNHVHVVLDADQRIHGKAIRPLLKRWITQAMDERWTLAKRSDGSSWWAEGGSTRPVRGEDYREDVIRYVRAQRTT